MKKKPNTDQFTLKKDQNSFLDGATADQLEKEKPKKIIQSLTEYSKADKRIHREQKVFRLSLELISILKRESYERSMNIGSRVTETELVEQALKEFFNVD